MNPVMRAATPDDLDLLCGFVREYYEFDGHPYDDGMVRQALDEFLRDPSLGGAWLICDGEKPVGYVVLTLGYSIEYRGRDSFIDEFFIRESHRGRGWGRQALDFVEGAARAMGVRAIHLEVMRSNAEAVEFYRHVGFESHDRHLMTKRI